MSESVPWNAAPPSPEPERGTPATEADLRVLRFDVRDVESAVLALDSRHRSEAALALAWRRGSLVFALCAFSGLSVGSFLFVRAVLRAGK